MRFPVQRVTEDVLVDLSSHFLCSDDQLLVLCYHQDSGVSTNT